MVSTQYAFDHFRDQCDRLYVDACTRGQYEHLFSYAFGLRQQETRIGKEVTVGLHAMASGPEIFPGKNILSLKSGCHIIPSHGTFFGDVDHNELEIVSLRLAVLKQADSWQGGQCIPVRVVVATVGLDDRIDALQVRQTHRGADLRHLAVCAGMDDVVDASKAEVAHEACGAGDLIVIGQNCPTLKGIEELGGVKTNNLGATKTSDHSSVQRAAESMGSVEHQLQPVLVGKYL